MSLSVWKQAESLIVTQDSFQRLRGLNILLEATESRQDPSPILETSIPSLLLTLLEKKQDAKTVAKVCKIFCALTASEKTGKYLFESPFVAKIPFLIQIGDSEIISYCCTSLLRLNTFIAFSVEDQNIDLLGITSSLGKALSRNLIIDPQLVFDTLLALDINSHAEIPIEVLTYLTSLLTSDAKLTFKESILTMLQSLTKQNELTRLQLVLCGGLASLVDFSNSSGAEEACLHTIKTLIFTICSSATELNINQAIAGTFKASLPATNFLPNTIPTETQLTESQPPSPPTLPAPARSTTPPLLPTQPTTPPPLPTQPTTPPPLPAPPLPAQPATSLPLPFVPFEDERPKLPEARSLRDSSQEVLTRPPNLPQRVKDEPPKKPSMPPRDLLPPEKPNTTLERPSKSPPSTAPKPKATVDVGGGRRLVLDQDIHYDHWQCLKDFSIASQLTETSISFGWEELRASAGLLDSQCLG